jgi:hypothetical protein
MKAHIYQYMPVMRGTKKQNVLVRVGESPTHPVERRLQRTFKHRVASLFRQTGRLVERAVVDIIADNVRAEAFAEALTGEEEIPF